MRGRMARSSENLPHEDSGDQALSHIARELEEHFRIQHTTLQIELGDSARCALTPEHVV
jgi:cobalt-zinc-cadmium efflux system protein